MNTNVWMTLVSALGMMLVGGVVVVYWQRLTRLQFRWFWVGAGLWSVAVILKVLCALLTNVAVLGFMKKTLSYPLLVVGGGLFVGIQSSLCEIGLTLLAVLVWRKLGEGAGRAIGVGVGAGAFEAELLGLSSLIAMVVLLAGVPGTEKVREGIETVAAVTPVFWLLGPTERMIAILFHSSSRALVLLGVTARKPMMIFSGFLIFIMVDGIAGATHVSGKIGKMSGWWIQLALLPFALVSVPVLRGCYTRWGGSLTHNSDLAMTAQEDTPADVDTHDLNTTRGTH